MKTVHKRLTSFLLISAMVVSFSAIGALASDEMEQLTADEALLVTDNEDPYLTEDAATSESEISLGESNSISAEAESASNIQIADTFLGYAVQELEFTRYTEITDEHSLELAKSNVFKPNRDQLEAATDVKMYGFVVDFVDDRDVAVMFVENGWTGYDLTLYDSQGNVVQSKSYPKKSTITSSFGDVKWLNPLRQGEVEPGAYYLKVSTTSAKFVNGFKTYQIYVGSYGNVTYWEQGRENMQYLPQYESNYLRTTNLSTRYYTDYWTTKTDDKWFQMYVSSAKANTLTVQLSSPDIHFEIIRASDDKIMFDSRTTPGALRTKSLIMEDKYPYTYKATFGRDDLPSAGGAFYHIRFYNTNVAYNETSKAIAVRIYAGEPLMSSVIADAGQRVNGTAISNTAGKQSTTSTIKFTSSSIPQYAYVQTMYLTDTSSTSKIITSRTIKSLSPSKTITNPNASTKSYAFDFKPTWDTLVPVKGNTFSYYYTSNQAYSITPQASVTYIYEIGD